MKKITFLSAILLTFIFVSCSNDSDDDMTPPPPPPNNVTYTNTVKAIIDGSCLNCHGNPPTNNAPMSLTTFDDVRSSVQSRGLITRVENGTMPPSGTNLTTAQVQAIKDWQSGGFMQ